MTLRLDGATIVRVDTLVPYLSRPWRKATRADVLRTLVLAGLDAEEERARMLTAPTK